MKSKHSKLSPLIGAILPLALVSFLSACSSTPTDPNAPKPQAEAAKSSAGTGKTAPNAQTPPTSPPPHPGVQCKKRNDEKFIDVEEVNSGCWLMYTSEGIKKRAAWSKKGNTHCETVRDNIRMNLEKAGYTCKWRE